MDKSIEKRFWPKVNKDGPISEHKPDLGQCWLWIGGVTGSGYGAIGNNGKTEGAHRVSYTMAKGEIPKGLSLDHLCRVRNCVNPDHLEAVTHKENVHRGEAPSARNKIKTHCKHGHEFNEKNTYQFTRSDGGIYRQCRICQKACVKKYNKKIGAHSRTP